MKDLALSYEELRTAVVGYLAMNPTGQFNDLRLQLGTCVSAKWGIAPDPRGDTGLFSSNQRSPELTPQAYGRVCNILWDLVIEGVVRPGLNDGSNFNLPFFHVTDFGKECIKDPATAYDPDGYMRSITATVPAVDPIVVTYLKESLHTFRINCLLSATIALGVASEKVLLLAIEAYGDGLPSPRKESFKKKTDGMVIKVQYDHFSKMVDSHLKGLLPNDVKENLDIALPFLFTMFRTHRNAAGHPTGKSLTRPDVHAMLTAFRLYLMKAYELIRWIKDNSPLT